MTTANRALQLLDNPIWHALSTTHSKFAEGDNLAKRYPTAVCPLAGIAAPSEAAYRRLAEIVEPEGASGMLTETESPTPEGWTLIWGLQLCQMTAESVGASGKEHEFVQLGNGDVPAMVDLCTLTRPGPFAARTHELGTYLGIKVDGVLAAMGGERMRLPGFTEISAVCTHPDYRGRGYSQALVAELGQRILERGEMPFLHVKPDNADAIHVYEKLGFRTRRHLYLAVLRNAR
jgi:predicted GNAT family acetyltransferase